MNFQSVNPATGAVLETFEDTTPVEIERILGQAWDAFLQWRHCAVPERRRRMDGLARLLRGHRADYARTMALEMGKPIAQGEAEVDKCAWACDYYAEHGEAFLAEQPRQTDASRSYVRFDPLGVVLAVMPWNFPFWQVFRFAAPALMAGNAAILKHAPNVPRCALQIEAAFREAGFPEGLFRCVFVGVETVPAIIADYRIRAVTLTGSGRAGSSVAEHAGREIKKSVLELGGSDPFIVLEDADLPRAAAVAAQARLVNSGQSCIAAKRFIVAEGAADRFIELLVAEMNARNMGDPLSRETQLGPQARHDLRAALHRQVEESVARGARALIGGRLPAGPGAFYPPTVLVGVAEGMPAFDEETFGPVAAVMRARDEDHALRLANTSRFGLGASIWTDDRKRAESLARDLEVGSVFVNGQVKSDPRLPFGGVKQSGYGRELSEYGFREFTNIKTVWIG